MEPLKDEKVYIKGKEELRDIIQINFKTLSGNVRGRYFPYINDDSPLGKLIIAIHGKVPDEIEDIAEYLINEEVVIEVKHNKSNNGKTYANAGDSYPIETEEDIDGSDFSKDLDEIEEEEEEIDIDLDFDEVEEEVYIDLDLDENKPTGSTRRRRNIKL